MMYQLGRNDNEERRATLACFVLYLFPDILRCYLSHYIYKKGLSNKYCNKKRNPPVLTRNELRLIEKFPNVQKFTMQLCYKLISFEGLLPTPSLGWGELPPFNALTVADDTERIRHSINEIRALNENGCTEVYLVKSLYKLEQIIHRLETTFGNTTVHKVYKSLLIKKMNTRFVLAELRKVGVIGKKNKNTTFEFEQLKLE